MPTPYETAYHTGVNSQAEGEPLDPNLDRAGWYIANSGNDMHPVGQKAPNAWQLYDMHGNVFEWVQDGYAPYPAGAVVDPIGPIESDFRIFRGGAWGYFAREARAANRSGFAPGNRDDFVGLRPARTL